MILKLFKEPLFYFFILSILFYLLEVGFFKEKDEIVVDDNYVETLINYNQLFFIDEDVNQKNRLNTTISNSIKEELFYIDAIKQNLDKEDLIFKRHLVKKYRQINFELLTSDNISDGELEEYYNKNISRYSSSSIYKINHSFFSFHDFVNPKKEAELFIKQGKPFIKVSPSHFRVNYLNMKEHEIREEFGIEFLTQLKQYKKVGRLPKPILSSFGYHVVEILSFLPSSAIPFTKIKGTVLRDYQKERILRIENEKYIELKNKTKIEYKLNKYKNLLIE